MTGPPVAPFDPAGPVRLVTLGGVGLYVDGQGEPVLGPGKPIALLAYLALTPGRRVSREFLLDLLWADLDPDRARSALRQVLFHLRRLLGDGALPGAAEVTLTLPLHTDRDRFLAALEAGQMEEAHQVYGGDFLPDFGVPGGAAFEQWADLERHRLRTAFLRCSEILVRRRLNESQFRQAQRLARRAREELPDVEAAWRLVLETVVAGRDFMAAAVEADAMERWATTEGVALDPTSRIAVARARQVAPEASDPPSNAGLMAELTGREREFFAITSAWENARQGPARHLHLAAPAGLGKTRLLREAMARLRAMGAVIVEAHGTPGDRDIPYAFAGELAEALAALPGASGVAPASASALVGLNPRLSSRLTAAPDLSTGTDALRRRMQALIDLVLAVAEQAPLVLVMDDLHWVDPLSQHLLAGLLGRLGSARVLCVTAARPECQAAHESAVVLTLPPLTPAQVGSVIAALGVVPPDEPWSAMLGPGLHAAAKGSPLLVLETLRLAMEDGILALADGSWRCADPDRLASLLQAGEAVRQRVRGLPQDPGWMLALLATAETPLGLRTLASLLSRPEAEVEASLAAMERQGLVVRRASEWAPAHDEIAAAARDALEPGPRRAAHQMLGDQLVASAGHDAQRLCRGARHLLVAGDERRVREQFRRYARLARERGDRRPFGELGAELSGEPATSPTVAVLVQSLPRLWRAGLWSPSRQRWAVAALALITIGSAGTLMGHGAREAAAQRLVYLDSAAVVHAIRLQTSEWDGRTDLVRLSRASSTLTEAARAWPDIGPAISPDGTALAWNQDSGDSTTIDIWIRTPAGERRLTREWRDDLVVGWLPDGSALLGLTNRWSSPAIGGYDVAVFDTATGAARPITRNDLHEGTPYASPDGTRIAFLREDPDGASRVCVTAFDGGEPAVCRLPANRPTAQLLGWGGLDALILTLDSAGSRPLLRYDWSRNEVTPLAGPQAYRARLSRDRRWVVAALQVDGIRGFRDWIIPLDRPANARRLDQPAGPAELLRWWEGPPAASDLIDRIEFQDTLRTIQLGFATRLRIRALTAKGTEVPVLAPVRWLSSDTLTARVDGSGDVTPRKPGTVTITASLAGWRVIAATFRVHGTPALTMLQEDWGDTWRQRWITFGDPEPTIGLGPGMTRAFWNRGDGTYASQAILREGFSAREGLGMEVSLSTPVTDGPWQRIRTALVAGIDTAAFQHANPRMATPSSGNLDATCGTGYPNGVGRLGAGRLAVSGGSTAVLELGALSSSLASGAWWTLRIQILPDGRCGLAVDGHVVWISPEPIPLDGTFRVRLGDESAGTRLLHGPLQVWTGVRTDIDWSTPVRR